MKKSELISQLQENCIEDEDFEVMAHVGQNPSGHTVFEIKFTFWHEDKLYLAIAEEKS